MDLTFLDLQHFSRVSKVLLIRDEWDVLIDIFNERKMGIFGSAVWTGQPGIGKTAILYFILVICLIKAQPFVFQTDSGFVCVVGNEVRKYIGEVGGADVLALVDGDRERCLPKNILLSSLNLRILLASSPRARQDRRWLTQVVHDWDALYVVSPWQWNEFAIASIFLSEKDITLHRLQKAVSFCGFNPRPVFKAVESEVKLVAAGKTIRNAIIHSGEHIGRSMMDVAGDQPVPHRAFMIYPGDEGRLLLDCLVMPVSDWAFQCVIETLDVRGAEAAYKLYQDIEGYPAGSAFRGQIWEQKVHRYLCSGNLPSFTIRSLEDSSTMEWNPFKNMSTINFGPPKTIADHLHECIAAKKAAYFRPKAKNFASFDSFIFEPNKPLLNFQITENYDHPVKTRGPKLLQELLSPLDVALKPLRPTVSDPWILLFIVPKPMETTFKKQKVEDHTIWEKKINQYVLGLDKNDVFKCSPRSFVQSLNPIIAYFQSYISSL